MVVSYVAYIDEAGDDGLKKVYPLYEDGSSEWFVLSCLLVRIENDNYLVKLAEDIVSKFKNSQSKFIHYRDLIHPKKIIACEALANAKIRSFVVMSNKKNMQNYVNERVARAPQIYTTDRNWFYWWIARCLLEKVTAECDKFNRSENKMGKLRIIFSRRGGMDYKNFREYLRKIEGQTEIGKLYLDTFKIEWSVIDHKEIFAMDHKSRAGLQLADIVASAFYQAVADTPKRPCDPQYAKLLKRTVACNIITAAYGDRYRQRFGYGLKLLPSIKSIQISPQQMRIFDFYRERDWLKKRR